MPKAASVAAATTTVSADSNRKVAATHGRLGAATSTAAVAASRATREVNSTAPWPTTHTRAMNTRR